MGAEITNPLNGEAVITLEDGRTVGLRFDLRAVTALEMSSNLSVIDLIESGIRPAVSTLANMIAAGAAGYSRLVDPSQVAVAPLAALDVIEACPEGYRGLAPVVLESLTKARGLRLLRESDSTTPEPDDPFNGPNTSSGPLLGQASDPTEPGASATSRS